MSEIKKAGELPEGENVYLKKDVFGWRVVSPWKNEDGTINWFNLLTGGKRNLFLLLFLLLLAGMFYLGVKELISNYQLVANNPCQFCTDCQLQTRQVIQGMRNIQLPKINLSSINDMPLT